ncbi:hypothetical protein [Qingshengfaniella alkalisoli]|uniref:Uncharacterized protein n=1 Tax=Qingshengfaniella alkalisoli TaxID=2599296 RepID=A0A5B8J4G5_9RHOB|nr:hypothetical protein [Qingshengfaniella alkalisoli]QDY69160.1 hypothetical protein FPZ52_05605 [Qingshengfaniella alkalisoli]
MASRSGLALSSAFATILATQAVAQSESAPLSAIPWLSESLDQPQPTAEPPATPAKPIGRITVRSLDETLPDASGLEKAEAFGLPPDLWSGSDPERLAELIATMPAQQLPAMQRLFHTLMIAETRDPPVGDGSLLRARVDALLGTAALADARSLIERTGTTSPDMFRRWFDIALLTGTEDRGCATLDASPELSPSYEARVFCLARVGRWTTAALTLETATALGRIDMQSRDLLARFLDPELFEGEPDLPLPEPITPLDYRLLEGIGERVPTQDLPLAFAHSDLRHVIGWKAQIVASERLVRDGAIDSKDLLTIYTTRRPSASGGAWDRVAAIQALDIAINAGDTKSVARALTHCAPLMEENGLEAALAHMMALRLSRLALDGSAAQTAYELALVSNSGAAFLPPDDSIEMPPHLQFASAVALDRLSEASPPDSRSAILAEVLLSGEVPVETKDMMRNGRVGEALLLALHDLASGTETDPDDIARALNVLIAGGQETVARHAALQFILLDQRA